MGTRIGKDSQLNEAKILQLLLRYQEETDLSVKRKLTEEIIQEFKSTLKTLAWKYGCVGKVNISFDDLYQQGAETILSNLDVWDPNVTGTIGGFFRSCIISRYKTRFVRECNRGRTEGIYISNQFVKDETVNLEEQVVYKQAMELLAEEEHTKIWKSFEEKTAYLSALEFILGKGGSFYSLINYLVKESDCTQHRAILIASHALVTVRVKFLENLAYVPPVDARIDIAEEELLGKRFMELSADYPMEELMVIFQGLTVRFPGVKLSASGVPNREEIV